MRGLWRWALWGESLVVFWLSVCAREVLIGHLGVGRLPMFAALAAMSFLALLVGVMLPIGGAIVADWLLCRMGQMPPEMLRRSIRTRMSPLLPGAIVNCVLLSLWWVSVAADSDVIHEDTFLLMLIPAQFLIMLWSMIAGVLRAMKKGGGTLVVAGVAVAAALLLPIVAVRVAIWVDSLKALFYDY